MLCWSFTIVSVVDILLSNASQLIAPATHRFDDSFCWNDESVSKRQNEFIRFTLALAIAIDVCVAREVLWRRTLLLPKEHDLAEINLSSSEIEDEPISFQIRW